MLNTTFIGLGAHARSVRTAALNAVAGEIEKARKAANHTSSTAWVPWLGADMQATYEAGPQWIWSGLTPACSQYQLCHCRTVKAVAGPW